MATASAGPSSSPPPQALPPRARAEPLLVSSVVTAATALLCVAVNVLPAAQAFRAASDIFGGIFRCYAVVVVLFVGLLEIQWRFLIKFWKVSLLPPISRFGM
nr:unnamed protein product [Digitaria exilis]